MYYRERGSPREREIFWAGDGYQVWFQILLHLWRVWDTADAVILDEPDSYLHADLQRRLVRMLEAMPAQVITATPFVGDPWRGFTRICPARRQVSPVGRARSQRGRIRRDI